VEVAKLCQRLVSVVENQLLARATFDPTAEHDQCSAFRLVFKPVSVCLPKRFESRRGKILFAESLAGNVKGQSLAAGSRALKLKPGKVNSLPHKQ
jgi:hypothetical protein